MNHDAEVIIVGLGAMGSAAYYYLSQMGVSVIGLDAYSPPHSLGSTHGETRLFRTAYFEHEFYVPLLKRAQDLWRELNADFGSDIFCQNGLLLAGDPETSPILNNSVASAKQYNIPIRELSAADLAREYPMFSWPGKVAAMFEPGAGFIHTEKAVESFLSVQSPRASKYVNCAVDRYQATSTGWQVQCAGQRFNAKKIIWTCGPWSRRWVPSWAKDLTLYRMILQWLACEPAMREIPCFGYDSGRRFFYGFPSLDGRTFKMADHTPEVTINSPEECQRQVAPDECAEVIAAAKQIFGAQVQDLVDAKTCIYTMTPDEHFYFDHHPDSQEMFVATGFSGHGFKFATVMGEALAQWACGKQVSENFAFLAKKNR